MTLIGLDSRSEEFDNLTLTVGMGTKLTLQDVRITGDKTLLSLAGGNTLTLLGENRLIGCADASGNACPTVISGGDLTICGSGSLKLQALVNNAAFMGAETSKISIENCLISVFKSDKLGFDGGAFCANGADLTMTNATFFGRTDSDNVAVLSADTIAMTGCTLRVEAEKSVHALLGSVSIADCSLYASGHSGNSAKTVSQTAGLDAFETVSQQSGVTASAADALLSVYTQAGEDGEKTLAKSYTAEELKKLAETKADGYGYQYFKKGEQDVVVTEFVTLDALLTDADVTFADGDSLSFVCADGPYTKYAPTYKDITEGKYYFKDGKAEEVPAALALVWGVGAAADGTVADIAKTAKEAGLRFVCGTTEADFTAEKSAGKRMPSGVMELIVVSAAKAEEKPAEEKPTEESPAEETKTGFTDVLDTDWFKADVEKAVENKLMTGTSATTFNPKGVTTRAMVVATLYRLAGSPEVTEKVAFTDVASGSYYEAAVAWAAKNEIASGTSATTFEPNKAVTREQLAKFLFNYAVYQGMDAVTLAENLSSFADHDSVSGYAVPAMQWAVGQGFINGTDGKLLPTGTATRCQFAAILNRFTAAQSEKA